MEYNTKNFGMHKVTFNIEPYEPFGFRTKEDVNAGRFFWVNRKQDRFTLTCNYREYGVTKNGKKYGRFKKLFSFSVTLRQPKTLNNMSFNVFYHGNVGGRKYNILNVTRNPSLVLGAFPSEINNLIIEEILSLVSRQAFFTQAELENIKDTVSKMKTEENYSSVTCMKLIQHISCPIVKSDFNKDSKLLNLNNVKTQRNNFEAFILPAFSMPLVRNKTIDGLIKSLKVHETNIAYFKTNIDKVNINSLYYLNITKNLVDSKTQKTILKKFFEEDTPEYNITARSWDSNLNGAYVSRLRQALRTLNTESRAKVLLDSEFIDYAPRLIKIWLGRSKFEQTFTITEPVNDVKEFYHQLIEYLNERKIELNTIQPNSIINSINRLNQGEVFEEDNTFMKATVGSFGNIKVWLPNDSQNSGMYQTWFAFDEVKKDSPLWKPIFEDDAFIKNPANLLGFYTKSIPATTSSSHIVFSPKMYVKFLQNLEQITKQFMSKYKIEDTHNNFSFVALIVIAFYSYDFPHFRRIKNIPPKIFNLYNKGLHPAIIEFAVEKRIPENIVEQYSDIPLEWAEKMLGAKQGAFSLQEYVF